MMIGEFIPFDEENPDPEAPATTGKPSYCEGKRAFTAWAKIEAYRQLKRLAVEKDTIVQALLEEGMDLVFERHGYPQIARK